MAMVMDTFSDYHLLKDDLLAYLKREFPGDSDKIKVEKDKTVYLLTIPKKLTKAQRDYILTDVCYRPDTDDDWG